jgi:aryl-alcohol dehydrogenase-like predicted oxidoreductase
MLERNKVEKEFVHLYRETGLGLTTYSPLKLGILSGKYNHGIPEDARLGQQSGFGPEYLKRVGMEDFQKTVDKVQKLEPIAQRLGVKQSVLAVAWVLANPNVSSAITGASRPAQIYETIEAVATYKKLTPDILKEIDEILENKPAAIYMRED